MMNNFPKKYKQKELKTLNAHYQQQHPDLPDSYSLFTLSATQPLHLWHAYALFLRDFLLKLEKSTVEHTIILAPKSVLSLSQAFNFFSKKGQSLQQAGRKKVSFYLFSQLKKRKKANQAFLNANFWETFLVKNYDADFMSFVYQTFFSLWDKWLVRFLKSIVYWSIDLQIAMPLEYISFVPEKCKNYTIKYFVETKNDILPICSLSVDDIFGDVALLVHPQDKRYKKLIGKRAIIPIVNRPIPIIGDSRVDISKNNGIKRVNPTSDFESIALAQEYNLPLDHYVFDKRGNYTQYAWEYQGKPRKEFYANILQFLQDITNLWTIYEEEHLVPYSTLSWEKLVPFLISELILDVISFKEDFLKEFSQSPFSEMDVENFLFLFDTPHFVLSRDTVFGLSLPLCHATSSNLSFVEFFSKFSYSDSDQECFDYILWYFSAEGFLTSLDSKKLTSLFIHASEQLFLFFSVLEKLYPHLSKSISKLTTLIVSKDIEQLKKYCDKFLESSYIVRSDTGVFSLHLESDGIMYEVLWQKFDDGFLEALYEIYFAQKNSLSSVKFVEQGQEFLFFQELVLQYLLLDRFLYSSHLALPSFLDKKNERYSYRSLSLSSDLSLFVEYGESPVKLSLLLKSSLSLESLYLYDYFLRQLWNGVRYCSLNYSTDFSLDSAFQLIKSHGDELDIRLMGELATLYLELTSLLEYKAVLDHFYYFQHFVQRKFLWWYLEIKKVKTWWATDAVIFVAYSFIFCFLFRFVPEYVRALMQISPYNMCSFEEVDFSNERSTQMIQLYELFDALYTFKMKLGIKKHQSISVFLKTDPNSLQIFEEYQSIFQQLLHIKSFLFVRLHEMDPNGYQQEIVDGITIGIQLALEGESFWEPRLADLEFDYTKKLEYLEYLRTLLSSPFISVETLREKQQEAERVKSELDDMYLQIQKFKLKKNT